MNSLHTDNWVHASLSAAIGTAFGISFTPAVIFTFLDADAKATGLNHWTLAGLRGSRGSCEWGKNVQAQYQAEQSRAKQRKAKQRLV